MLDAGIPADECFRILHQLEELGILVNDLGLTVRLSKGGSRSADSTLRLITPRVCAVSGRCTVRMLDIAARSSSESADFSSSRVWMRSSRKSASRSTKRCRSTIGRNGH